jgi:hypothetical protein
MEDSRDPPRTATGIIRTDPSEDADVKRMSFVSHFKKLKFDSRIARVADWENLHGDLLLVAIGVGHDRRVIGTAVLVAPGIALSATHVFSELVDVDLNPKTNALCMGTHFGKMQIWSIVGCTLVANSDVAILSMKYASEMPPNNTFFRSALTTRIPRVGERLVIMGFRSEASHHSSEGAGSLTTTGNVWVSQGQVSEVYPHGRDRVILPGPSVQVECPSLGGMSGGPAYNDDGRLVGVLSSSYDFGGGEGASYVSLHWTALAAQFQTYWLAGITTGISSLLEMVELCDIERRDAIQIIDIDGPTKRALRLTQW